MRLFPAALLLLWGVLFPLGAVGGGVDIIFTLDGDSDRDGVIDRSDNCQYVANRDQADRDGDDVGDLCDNCPQDPNPRVSFVTYSANPWMTTTGGQRDDDADGYGNMCDGNFGQGPFIDPLDTVAFLFGLGEPLDGDTCGTSGLEPCAEFDVDESASGTIDDSDLQRFLQILGGDQRDTTRFGCPLCPMPCFGPACGRPDGDADADGIADPNDNCPLTPNAGQADAENDRVGDACDNCPHMRNPYVAPSQLRARPWATTTGRQRDDDADSVGNACDGKFPGVGGSIVGGLDTQDMLHSMGRPIDGEDCGRERSTPCAVFDVDRDEGVTETDLVYFLENLLGTLPAELGSMTGPMPCVGPACRTTEP